MIGKKCFVYHYEPEQIISGYYISEIYDSRSRNTVWQRAEIKDNHIRYPYSIHFYAAEEKSDEIVNARFNGSYTIKEKMKLLSAYYIKTIHNKNDCLLHDVSGRYLWYVIEFHEERSIKEAGIEYIKIYFPKESFIKYLPEVYSENNESTDFLVRFLAVFQTIYEDIDDLIDKLPVNFLPKSCHPSKLPFIAGMLAEDSYQMWEEDKLRILLSNSVRFYGYRGTKRGLLERIKLFIGEEAYLAENHRFNQEREGGRKHLIKSLYGSDPLVITLLFREGCLTAKDSYNKLIKIAKACIPAYMECRVVVLKPYIFLDSHSYLGINTMLKEHDIFELNSPVVIPFSTIV